MPFEKEHAESLGYGILVQDVVKYWTQDFEVSLAHTAQATMKLRCKGENCAVGGTSEGFSLQVDDNCDWYQLRQAITRQRPYLERVEGFSLSLNKRVSSFTFCAQQ